MDLQPPVTDAIVAALESGQVTDKQALHRLKHRLAREHGLQTIPRDSDVIAALPEEVRERHIAVLRKKPMRTGSGVAIVAVMSSPAACPHGKCVYCPGGPEVDAPQSYTGFEPSTMRAKRFSYDPYRVVRNRLAQLADNGHAIDKIDVIVQGGTFPAREPGYQDWFIAGIYQACNAGPDSDPAPGPDEAEWAAMTGEQRRHLLRDAMQANEDADCRVIGLTVETKPDWCHEPHVDAMLAYGTTRVELGIQTLDEEVTQATNRGHDIDDARHAMRVAREAGLKICTHMMPGLPRRSGTDAQGRAIYAVDADADRKDIERLFAETDWRPDMLKIYPMLIVQEGETPVKRWWREGRFEPLGTESAVDVVADLFQHVPTYCRVQRVDRDIPTTHVVAGVMHSNLRQLAEDEAARRGIAVRDIRAREVHRRAAEGAHIDPQRVRLVRHDYEASSGLEVFLSLEDPDADAIVGFLRLRRLAAPHRAEAGPGDAMVRELKVYGYAQALGDHDDPATGAWQHQGHGARLLEEAERIAFEEWTSPRIHVIAGVGVRAYYRRHGYADHGAYVMKEAT